MKHPQTARDTYIHQLPGRLRVRDPRFRRNASRAAKAVDRARSAPGVKHATANEVTGSLTVHYDPSLTTGDLILRRLRIDRPPIPRAEGADGSRLLRSIALFALEKAAEHSVAALFSAVL